MFVLKSTYNKMKAWADRNQNAFLESNQKLFHYAYEVAMLRNALEDIIAQKTEHPNATVTRMVRIAEEALGDFNGEEDEPKEVSSK